MGSPFFARPHAHGHFPSIAQLPPLSTSLCTSSDCDHPSGNRSISCPRESPDSSPTSGSSAERATSLPPSFPHLHLRHVGGLPPSPPLASPSSFGRPGRPLSITVFLAAAENGPAAAAADPAAARRLQRARGKGGGALARSLAPSRPASLQLVNRSPREKRRDRGSDCSIRMRSFRTASLRCGARDISAERRA